MPANETYQPRSSAVGSRCGDEKQWRTTVPRVAGERGERVVVGGARVDDDGLPELGRELELLREEPLLRVARRVVAEPVEARLADRDRLRMREELAQRVDVVLGRVARLVRMETEDREDAVVRLGERAGCAGSPRRRCRR